MIDHLKVSEITLSVALRIVNVKYVKLFWCLRMLTFLIFSNDIVIILITLITVNHSFFFCATKNSSLCNPYPPTVHLGFWPFYLPFYNLNFLLMQKWLTEYYVLWAYAMASIQPGGVMCSSLKCREIACVDRFAESISTWGLSNVSCSSSLQLWDCSSLYSKALPAQHFADCLMNLLSPTECWSLEGKSMSMHVQ